MIAAARNKPTVCRLLIDSGADWAALDPSGKSALEIAAASGSTEAASAIELALNRQARLVAPLVLTPVAMDREQEVAAAVKARLPPETAEEFPHCQSSETPPSLPDKAHTAPSDLADASALSAPSVQAPPLRIDFEDDGEPLDLSGWEAEEEIAPPTDDRPAVIAHLATQGAIALHAALDDSADWADFEVDLPAHAAPLLRAQDAEGRNEIRALLLRTSREGSIPAQTIEDVCRDVNGARDPVTEALLGVVISDMGAECDERFEYRSPFESFEVFTDPRESAFESETINEALGFLDNLRSRHNEPIRLYMREAQRTVLLSAEDEVELSKSMDWAADVAIDALSRWPTGIDRVERAIGSARRGERSVNSIVSSARDVVESVETNNLDDVLIGETRSPSGLSVMHIEDGESTPATPETQVASVFTLAEELVALTANQSCERSADVRATLVALSPRRSFLIELSEGAGDDSAEGERYAKAIRALILMRDKMASANLRLVISLAKKYLYSGVPLDDLIQDGNIGLMNAVDKFDWRRGFRFSTMATWWIRQQIARSVADSSLSIRLPVHVFEIAQRFPREVDTFEKRTGHPPNIQQLATLVEHDWRKVEALVRACSVPLSVESFDCETSFDTSNASDSYEKTSTAHLHRTLNELLAELDTRSAKIIRLRFGMGGGDPQTLEEIGALFDVTRERIRQIESRALRKLQQPNRLVRLRPDLYETKAPAPSAGSDKTNSGSKLPPSPSTTQIANPSLTRHPKVAQAKSGNRLTSMERVLREAILLDIQVEQTARDDETKTWVKLTKAANNRHRNLIRSLLAIGFKYSPSKGYWR